MPENSSESVQKSPHDNAMELVKRRIQDLTDGSPSWGVLDLARCVEHDGKMSPDKYREIQEGFIRHVFKWAGITTDPFEKLPEGSTTQTWTINSTDGSPIILTKEENVESPGDFTFTL